MIINLYLRLKSPSTYIVFRTLATGKKLPVRNTNIGMHVCNLSDYTLNRDPGLITPREENITTNQHLLAIIFNIKNIYNKIT